MATKAQKRAAGEARQAEFLKETIESGLKAQKGDHDRRAQRQKDLQAKKKQEEAEKNKANAAKVINGMMSPREDYPMDQASLEYECG